MPRRRVHIYKKHRTECGDGIAPTPSARTLPWVITMRMVDFIPSARAPITIRAVSVNMGGKPQASGGGGGELPRHAPTDAPHVVAPGAHVGVVEGMAKSRKNAGNLINCFRLGRSAFFGQQSFWQKTSHVGHTFRSVVLRIFRFLSKHFPNLGGTALTHQWQQQSEQFPYFLPSSKLNNVTGFTTAPFISPFLDDSSSKNSCHMFCNVFICGGCDYGKAESCAFQCVITASSLSDFCSRWNFTNRKTPLSLKVSSKPKKITFGNFKHGDRIIPMRCV